MKKTVKLNGNSEQHAMKSEGQFLKSSKEIVVDNKNIKKKTAAAVISVPWGMMNNSSFFCSNNDLRIRPNLKYSFWFINCWRMFNDENWVYL